jgi:hypothetical protein
MGPTQTRVGRSLKKRDCVAVTACSKCMSSESTDTMMKIWEGGEVSYWYNIAA